MNKTRNISIFMALFVLLTAGIIRGQETVKREFPTNQGHGTVEIKFGKVINLTSDCKDMDGPILQRVVCLTENETRSTSAALEIAFFYTFSASGISILEDDSKMFDMKSGNLLMADMLDRIVRNDPRYSWKEDNGVINILPQNDYEILDTRIADFKIENISPDDLRKKILEIPEFQLYLKKKGLVDKIDNAGKYGYLVHLHGKPALSSYVSLNMKNATLREILNEIVRQRRESTWSYREYHLTLDGKQYYTYQLRV